MSIGSTIGKVAQTSQESTTNQQINAVEPYDNFDDDFIFTSLENISGSIKAIASNQAVPIVNKTTFGETEIKVPSELAEQQKIGAYFRNLDHLITLHQRKCEETKSLKKYMLQKMFPENGKCVPKIRFSGFSDDWEQRKVGNFLTESREVGHKGDVAHKMTVKLWSKGICEKNEAGSSNTQYFIRHTGQFIYSKLDFLNCAFGVVPKNLESFETTADVPAFDCNEINPYFMFYTAIQPAFYKKNGIIADGSRKAKRIHVETFLNMPFFIPNLEEQNKIVDALSSLDHLITLHQRKCYRFIDIALDAWEQRKLDGWGTFYYGRSCPKWSVTEDATIPCIRYGELYTKFGAKIDRVYSYTNMPPENLRFSKGTEVLIPRVGEDPMDYNHCTWLSMPDVAIGEMISVFNTDNNPLFTATMFNATLQNEFAMRVEGGSVTNLYFEKLKNIEVSFPSIQEQEKIAAYFENLDHLITLHQHKLFCAKNVMKYITTDINTPKKEAIMAELESVIEQKLIEQLIYGDSQWTYREDLKTEADLWKNFRYILEQNNKERLNGEPLSDAEFEQVKNQLQFSSFYKAGEWLVGENGKVMVHVQRDTERLHLVVMNHEHIAGGSSVYEVINQYNALKMDEDSSVNARDRRFDVTLMINGLPMIHIELKNKQHSYMDGFWQIKKYIGEGKFTGIFSAVQMFVISNGVDTKYFSAASDTELNPKFISGWLDKENNAVSDYLVFAKSVLRIPEAHEMIARYTVLDEEAKRLILLRPYQIHAIEAIRDASKTGKSGFVWHTTGSGKTLTSYKATRNLLMDIPAIDKAIFLIDRKDLDTQTTMAFQAYANNDLIDVDETDNVFDLKKKLKSDDRQVIVTTIQKLQRLITRKLQEGTPEYHKIKNLKIAFVVDDERVIIRTKLEKPSKIKGLALI